jgi:hypothetical protein
MPAKAGIKEYQMVTKALDLGFRRGDDFLRDHQSWLAKDPPLLFLTGRFDLR